MPTDPNNTRYPMQIPRGEGPYDDDLNTILDDLAVDVPNVGAIADRPAATNEFAPVRYYAPDAEDGAGVEYFNTGSSWESMRRPIQMAEDGYVVPVSVGTTSDDAINPTTTDTPVMDAVKAINRPQDTPYDVGFTTPGTVLLPPKTIEDAGGWHHCALKTIRGFGYASRVHITDPAGSGINVSGLVGSQYTTLTDFVFDGDAGGNRTGGSAILSQGADVPARGFNIGRLWLVNWQGPDPVIHFLDASPFSNRWEYLRGNNFTGNFIRIDDGFFDYSIGKINVASDSTDTIIHLSKLGGPSDIEAVNIGGNALSALYVDKNDSGHSGLEVGHINLEPGTGGTTSGPAPVELYGATTTIINRLTIEPNVTCDYAVAMGGSINHSGSGNDGSGNNRIGQITERGGAQIAKIGVLDPPQSPSWYWGPGSDIDYGGQSTSAVIPLADVDYTI